MILKEIEKKENIDENIKLAAKIVRFNKLFSELRKNEITDDIGSKLNEYIDEINSFSGTNRMLLRKLRNMQPKILGLLEKELKLVPKNYYRDKWLAIGLSVFGVSLGVAFGAAMGNMAFLGIGIPIGMVLGIGIGTSLDKKAFAEGRQLDVEMKY